jgi:Putative 2OG-Fe(II) oxygenase/Tetratricopeptide repeat
MIWDPTPQDAHKYQPIFMDLARKAAALRPDIMGNWERLAWHLLGAGEYEEAIRALTRAVSEFPTEPRPNLMLADIYYKAGRLDLAHKALHRASVVPINDRETIIYRLELLMTMKAVKDLGQVAIDTLALDPTNITALRGLGRETRKNGNPEIMIPICQAALEHEPGHTQALYELALAFMSVGRSEEARDLMDINRFVTVIKVCTPQTYANAEAFESALASEIIRNATLKPDPLGRATRGGFQTMGGLPHAGEFVIGEVINLIRLAVDEFVVNLPETLDHPFIKGRPKRADLNAWAVVYPGEGRQVAHIHATSWLSGVYYVSVPRQSCSKSRNGCLVLGAFEIEGQSLDPPWGMREIKPVSGGLVLFPSYIPHATIPTGSPDKRICIAFDVKPPRTVSDMAVARHLDED